MLINSNVAHDLSESAYNERRSVGEKVAVVLNVEALRDASIDNLNKIKTKYLEKTIKKHYMLLKNTNASNHFQKQFSKMILMHWENCSINRMMD